jgi:hypothetical protein
MLLVTNLDRAHTDYDFFETNPFVLPVMKKGNHDIFLNSNSYIELPIVNPGAGALEFAFEDDLNSAGTIQPGKFSLSQNYPNPFNPSTVIEYSISHSGHVELRVYDALGREVRTLVSSIQNPGSYSVTFNASGLSSGVYFYRLTAGEFDRVKRMILIK